MAFCQTEPLPNFESSCASHWGKAMTSMPAPPRTRQTLVAAALVAAGVIGALLLMREKPAASLGAKRSKLVAAPRMQPELGPRPQQAEIGAEKRVMAGLVQQSERGGTIRLLRRTIHKQLRYFENGHKMRHRAKRNGGTNGDGSG